MAFIRYFFATAVLVIGSYLLVASLLIKAPVAAEYWVREMITIKQHQLSQLPSKDGTRIIVTGGSSTLFAVDAEQASRQLGMPVFNYGLHAGLSLQSILQSASEVAVQGDRLVLLLEPVFFECSPKFTEWQLANIIGWDRKALAAMGPVERLEFTAAIPVSLLGQMALAQSDKMLAPQRVSHRLATLDDAQVLAKFRARPAPTTFEYSAYHLSDYGDLLRIDGAQFNGRGVPVGLPNAVCDTTITRLADFTQAMAKKGVRVFYANPPYVDSSADLAILRSGEASFKGHFAPVGCMIDRREDLVFDRKYFFNTGLHLNAEGRKKRTDLLVDAIRRNALQGRCETPPTSSPRP